MTMIKFLNENSGAFSVLFSFVVMVSTVVYALLTWFLVRETKKLRKAETDPNISIYLEPEEQWISLMDLVIQNNGRGAAYDIRFKITPDFECRKGEFLSANSFMQHMRYMAPGQRLRFFLASAVDVLPRETGKAFKITASYRSVAGQTYQEEFDLDFEHFRGMVTIGKSPIYKIADVLEKIQKEWDHIASGFRRLKVEVWDQADLEKEREEYEKRREEFLKQQERKDDPPQ